MLRPLPSSLRRLLPADIHERCSGKAHVAVTTVFPRPRGLLVSEFSSRDDLIAALLTSCHIPWCAPATLRSACLMVHMSHVCCLRALPSSMNCHSPCKHLQARLILSSS